MPLSRQSFQDDLEHLEQALIEMASLAERMVGDAVDSLTTLDCEKAMATIRKDDQIDALDVEIEQQCLKLLALQQPMASDLRTIGTAMKMITDIERIGDLAVDIAKICLKVEKEMGDPNVIDIPRMANIARRMVHESIEAFVKRDLEKVMAIVRMDDEVDDLYRELRGQLHEIMKSNPDRVVEASWLLMAIHHIERVADHATNIAERVHFMETGKLENLASSHKPDSQ